MLKIQEMTNSPDKDLLIINILNQNLNNIVRSSSGDYGNVS
jgi:hypothetical protein